MLGNAALSLEWVECRRKTWLFERVPEFYIFFVLLRPCDSYLRSAPFRLNALKHWIFERAPRRLLLFDLKDVKENSGGAVLIKCVFSSCVVPESFGFASWSVCACVILGAGSRGRGLWGCIKGLLVKNSRTVPWRETYLGKSINEWLRQRKTEQKGLFWTMRLFYLIFTNICPRKN